MTVTQEVSLHIEAKMDYHEKLRQQMEAVEDYERCAYHRDEIKRLQNMISE
jgi:protein-arginine kinase activator protein McsA